jgi:hypothetical protein
MSKHRDEIKTIWLNAYNAALTGLLASRKTFDEKLKPDANTISLRDMRRQSSRGL